jgi:hypothetical protein
MKRILSLVPVLLYLVFPVLEVGAFMWHIAPG